MTSPFWNLYDVPLGLEIGLPSAAFVAAFIYLAERRQRRSEYESQANRQQASTARSRRTTGVMDAPPPDRMTEADYETFRKARGMLGQWLA